MQIWDVFVAVAVVGSLSKDGGDGNQNVISKYKFNVKQ